jgi:hypothetical protein
MSHLATDLYAVLHIFSYDEELQTKALPHVDVEKKTVDWYSIFRNNFGSGHYAAVAWAYCLWRGETPDVNPFEAAFSMDAGLRRAVLRAIAIRWSLPIDNIRALRCA